MELFRLAAFAVAPARLEATAEPEGGSLRISGDLRHALAEVANRVKDEEWTNVDFLVDENTRTCEMRDLLLAFVFGDDTESAGASLAIAVRLGAAMDRRSHPFLLLEAGYREDEQRKSGLWAFPRDDAFRFVGGKTPVIELLADVFSRTSRLRKGAEFGGRHHRADFLSGHVLDLQAGPNVTNVANYWIERFLECTLALTAEIGTTVLAQALRAAYASAGPSERAQLHVAAIAMRHGPVQSLSISELAGQYLDPELAEKLVQHSPEPSLNSARFRFKPETFDRFVTTHVYNLDSGVIVSAPLDEVGTSVVIDDDRRLTATGRIATERIKGG